MIVAIQAKHLRFSSGGNSTYASALLSGLGRDESVQVRTFGPPAASTSYRRAVAQLSEGLTPLASGSGEVLHFTGDTGPLARRRGSVIVTTVHGYAAGHVEDGRSRLSGEVWRRRVRRAIRLSDAVVTVSESSRKDLCEHLGADPHRVRVIHSGIDHDRFGPRVPALPVADERCPPPFVLYLGNIEPRKNLVRAIAAFLRSSLPAAGWTFVLAGRMAWSCAETTDAIRRAGPSVRYVGAVPHDDVPRLLRSAQGFFFPSLYEGFGFPPLEAMASGVPVIASHRGALAEVLGEAAIEVDPLDEVSMASGLDLLQDDGTLDGFRRRGLENAARFTWDRSLQMHLDLYREVAA